MKTKSNKIGVKIENKIHQTKLKTKFKQQNSNEIENKIHKMKFKQQNSNEIENKIENRIQMKLVLKLKTKFIK
jgi:hypothetical protein